MELIDAHVHVWDRARFTYHWLGEPTALPVMLPADYERASGGTTGAVFVQAADGDTDPVAEARWVDGLDWPGLGAIVAAADLRARPRALSARVDALRGIDRVAGVRDLLQDRSVSEFPAYLPGLRLLADRRLTFDACVRHGQLRALNALVAGAPGLTVVIDHLGKPPVDAGIGSDSGSAWAAAMTALARHPETFVKLSGLAAEARDRGILKRNAPAFIDHVLEAFGPRRCMIGSDWPVSALFGAGGTFAEWVETVRARVPDEQWPEVAAGTARRVYRIGATRPASVRSSHSASGTTAP